MFETKLRASGYDAANRCAALINETICDCTAHVEMSPYHGAHNGGNKYNVVIRQDGAR